MLWEWFISEADALGNIVFHGVHSLCGIRYRVILRQEDTGDVSDPNSNPIVQEAQERMINKHQHCPMLIIEQVHG